MADVVNLTSLAQLNALSASVTQSLVLQQEEFGQDNLDATAVAVNSQTTANTKTGGNVLRYQPHIGDADIQGLFERIRLPVRTGTAARFKGLPGPADIGNGFQVVGSSNFGLAWLYQNLTQDMFPTSEYLGGGTRPTPHTVVDNGELTDTNPLTVVAIPATFNNPVQALVTPSDSSGSTQNVTRTVVNDGDLTGGTAIRIADDLANVMTPQALNVALTSASLTLTILSNGALTTAALTSFADDLSAETTELAVTVQLSGATFTGATATVQIVGTDAGGAAATETLTFAPANADTAQTTTETYATITAINNAGFTGGTLTATANRASGTVVITGTDGTGATQTSTQTFTGANLTTAQATTDTYATVTGVTVTGFTAGTVDITATFTITFSATTLGIATGQLYGKVVIEGTDHRDQSIERELRWSASNINNAMTTDAYFKTITRVTTENWSGGAIDIVVNDQATRVTFEQQDTELVDFFTLELAKGGVPFTYRDLVISNFTASLSRSDPVVYTCAVLGGVFAYRQNVDGGTDETDISGFDDASEAAFTGPSVSITVDGTALPLTSANLGINHNLAPANYMTGSVFQAGKPVRDNEREMTIGGTIQASAEDDYQNLAFRNATIPNVELTFRNGFEGTFGDFPAVTRFICDEMEFTGSTDFGITGRSRITHDLVLTAIAERGSQDYRIIADFAKYDDPVYRYA